MLAGLITNYVRLSEALDPPFVLQKLCSCLTAFALKPSSHWNAFIRHLLVCFLQSQYVDEDAVGTTHEFWARPDSISFPALRSVLWFASDIAGDFSRASFGGQHL